MALDEVKASAKVFEFFEEISAIPRCSFNEKQISDYLVKFAKSRNLEVYQDEIYNVVIKKQATPNLIGAPTVILQGHIDMVCEKNSDMNHNFNTDPIKLVFKEDMLCAQGTTLGADNGIAVAMMLAILDADDLSHPNLECAFTAQEEVGLDGAKELNPTWLDGKVMINIDSEEYGNFLVSCAGGGGVEITLDTHWTMLDGEFEIVRLKVSGLKGGHSGINIIEERGNAIKILGRLLAELENDVSFEIQHIEGGSKDNAIPREAFVDIAIDPQKFIALEGFVSEWISILNNELRNKDNPIDITIKKISTDKVTVYNQDTKNKLIYLLAIARNGVNTMSADIEGLVESSQNLGVITQDATTTKVAFSIRSSVESLLNNQITELQLLATALGGKAVLSGVYPGWEYNPVSPLRDLFVDVYKSIEKEEPKVSAIHAGLECGILKQKLGEVDIISIGPDIFNPHSPDEHASIGSIDRTYTLILEVLKQANRLA